MQTWRVGVCGVVLTGLLMSTSMASAGQDDVGQEHSRSRTTHAHNMQERWKAINEIASLITAGNFTRASELAKNTLPLPKDLTTSELQELAQDFDARVQAFRHSLEGGDPLQSLQAWNTVFQGCVVCHIEQGITGQKLQE
jgi:hypothetical protein